MHAYLIIALILIAPSLVAGETVKVPKMVIADTNADLGNRIAGDLVPIRYSVRNDGEAELQIIQVGASCGCLAPQRTWPAKLAPGQSGTIELVVDTSSLSGTVAQPLTVFANDPASAKVSLWVKGTVERIFAIEPVSAVFGTVDASQAPPAREIIIRNLSAELRTLSAPSAESTMFSGKLIETTAGKAWRLSVAAQPPFAYGMNAGAITLTTDHPRLPKLRIEASAWLQPPVQAIPPRLVVPSEPLKEPLRRVIMVRSRPGEAWSVTDVTCTDSRVTVGKPEADGSGLVRVTVELPAGYALSGDQVCEIKMVCISRETRISLTVPMGSAVVSTGHEGVMVSPGSVK